MLRIVFRSLFMPFSLLHTSVFLFFSFHKMNRLSDNAHKSHFFLEKIFLCAFLFLLQEFLEFHLENFLLIWRQKNMWKMIYDEILFEKVVCCDFQWKKKLWLGFVWNFRKFFAVLFYLFFIVFKWVLNNQPHWIVLKQESFIWNFMLRHKTNSALVINFEVPFKCRSFTKSKPYLTYQKLSHL